MPIYEYACEKCENEFEVEQRITEDPIRTCPHCRSRKVRRLISQTSFVLKGGGWYSDLYSSSGKAKSEPSGKGGGSDAKSGSDAPASAGTDSKGPSPDPGGKKGKKKAEAKAAA